MWVQQEQSLMKARLRPSVLISWAVLPSAEQLVVRQAVGDPADGAEEWCVRECGQGSAVENVPRYHRDTLPSTRIQHVAK